MKKKNKKTSNPILIVLSVGLLLVACILVPHLLPQKALERSPEGAEITVSNAVAHLRQLKTRYLTKKMQQTDVWWLLDPPALSDREKITSLANGQITKVKEMLKSYKDVSAFAASVAERHDSLFVTLAIAPAASVAVMGDEERKQAGKSTELSFVPKNVVPRMPGSFSIYWRSDWGLLMSAVKFPRAVFPGLLFHELGHGYLHPVGPDTKYHSPNSVDYALEECQMHELETLVMDKASTGQFQKALSRITARLLKNKSIDDFIQGIVAEDFSVLDASLGATEAGLETSSLLYAHYVMAIGLDYLGQNKGGDSKKVELFRLMEQSL